MSRRTSSSYGHEIIPRSALPDDHWIAQGMDGKRRLNGGPIHCSNGIRCPGVHEESFTWESWDKTERTSTHHVGSIAVYYASYMYVTGRGGNVSRRDLYFCQPCAEKFAKRHSLTIEIALPDEAAR